MDFISFVMFSGHSSPLSVLFEVLSRGQFSFLQRGSNKADFQKLTDSLSKIISATWVNSQQKAVVQSLLQSQSTEDDEDLSLQPQATAAAFTSQGGGILDTIKDMTEKAEGTLTDARGTEMKSQHAFLQFSACREIQCSENLRSWPPSIVGAVEDGVIY